MSGMRQEQSVEILVINGSFGRGVVARSTGSSSANPAVGLMRGIGLQSVVYLPFSLGSP